MKRFYLLMLALLTLTLQAATVKIGYYKSDGDYFWAYDGFGQPPVDMKFGAAIRITPDMYANYLGADIKGIRIGWSNPDYSSPCTIFMRSELNSKENILTGSGTLQFEKSSQPMMGKYTTIYFDNPDGMKLTEDLGTFYVGYYAEKVKQGTFAIATSYPGGQAGSAYLWGDIESNYDADGNEIWEDDSDKATLCVDLIVEGTFTNKVRFTPSYTQPSAIRPVAGEATKVSFGKTSAGFFCQGSFAPGTEATVYDLGGSIVAQTRTESPASQLALPMHGAPRGTYLVKVNGRCWKVVF